MDPFIQFPKLQICNKHNQPILFYDPNPNKGAYCSICLQEINGLIPAESQHEKLMKIYNEQSELCNNFIELFEDWRGKLVDYKNKLIANLEKLIKVIVDQSEIIETFKSQHKQLIQNSTDYQKTSCNLQMEGLKFFKEREQVKAQLKQQLLDFQKQLLNNANDLLLKELVQEPQVNIPEVQINKWRFEYDLMSENCRKEDKYCLAFAFNKEGNILVVAQVEQIVVYQFNRGVIGNEIQRLIAHTQYIYCLYFMKQSDSFASGSKDGQIIIWECEDKTKRRPMNKWFIKTKLKAHESKVYCIIMAKSENLMISSSLDTTIKFWNKNNSGWKIQQTITAFNEVYEISLNEKENKLISCVSQQVYILEKQVDNIWRIVQIINIQSCILGFTQEEQFILQTYDSDKIDIYNYNQSKRQFEKVEEVQNQKYEDKFEFFSCQYIQNLNIVSVKHGKQLCIFKTNLDCKYQLVQTMKFGDDLLYGRLSDDGQYLVTWDNWSKHIQVRSLECNK